MCSFNALELVVMKAGKGIIHSTIIAYIKVYHVSCFILRYEMLSLTIKCSFRKDFTFVGTKCV